MKRNASKWQKLVAILRGDLHYCFECRCLYPTNYRSDDWRYCGLCK